MKSKVQKFHKILFSWWEGNKRDLPWRHSPDKNKKISPYEVLVSEFMLQQTQVTRVVPKYNLWLKRFPSIDHLAQSSNADVIKNWAGLGYNRRAIWLRDAAIELKDHQIFPDNPDELLKIKGIGKYTSRAIPIFAFNADIATIDVNIRRVLLHEKFIKKTDSESTILEIASKIFPFGQSRDYHSALMDYGALIPEIKKIKFIKNPNKKFVGSDRELRGKIISQMIDGRMYTTSQFGSLFGEQVNRIQKLLNQMIKDDLVTKINGNYKI